MGLNKNINYEGTVVYDVENDTIGELVRHFDASGYLGEYAYYIDDGRNVGMSCFTASYLNSLEENGKILILQKERR